MIRSNIEEKSNLIVEYYLYGYHFINITIDVHIKAKKKNTIIQSIIITVYRQKLFGKLCKLFPRLFYTKLNYERWYLIRQYI